MRKIVTLILTMSTFVLGDVAIVKKVTGEVEVKRDQEIIEIQVGSSLKDGDIIMSKSHSSVGIIFDDGSRLSLGEKAIFVIKNFKVNPSKKEYDIDLNLKKGKAVFSSGKVGKLAPESVKFRIPEGIIGIRGTKFAVEVR
ncbi:MAG: FecR domain-containing protein [Epsilonproteobacteria bacterium]|nr:FecR domain-containing protein [Campylobacterota bacterium]